MSAETIARSFLTAFYRGDSTSAREFLTDDFDFAGPFVALIGADQFLDSAAPLLDAARHTLVRHTWAQDGHVCVIHDVTLDGAPDPITMADWFTVRDGRLARERVVFDTAPLRAVLAHHPPAGR